MAKVITRKNIKQVLQNIADHFALGRIKYARRIKGSNQNYVAFTDKGHCTYVIFAHDDHQCQNV